jgi:MerR family mercuric resistance operon transcriptional regulator
MPMQGMTRGQLARRTGRNLETIRYYEKIGLLPDPPRSGGGYRQYEASHERRLRFIMRARELGFGIAEIRGLLKLVDRHAYTCVEVRDMTLNHLAAVRLKIADLKRLERTLATTVAACAGRKVPECPVIDALSGASEPRVTRAA